MPSGKFAHDAANHSPVCFDDFALGARERRRSTRLKSILADRLFDASANNVQVWRAMFDFCTLQTDVIAKLYLSDLHYGVAR